MRCKGTKKILKTAYKLRKDTKKVHFILKYRRFAVTLHRINRKWMEIREDKRR